MKKRLLYYHYFRKFDWFQAAEKVKEEFAEDLLSKAQEHQIFEEEKRLINLERSKELERLARKCK